MCTTPFFRVGYDVHVAALVQSAVVVWNDGVTVQIGDKPFYPSFPLLSFAEVQKAVQMPENVDEEVKRCDCAEVDEWTDLWATVSSHGNIASRYAPHYSAQL